MIGRAIGSFFCFSRDHVARGLIFLGVTPNILTLTGMTIMSAVGVCLAIGGGNSFAWSLDPRAGANAFPLLAAAMMMLSNACDMLDGAVARIGGKGSTFGAFLDSTMDRFADFAVFAGLAIFYAARGNVTFTLLAMLAFLHGFMISYARARAEDFIDDCEVGYWQRGERMAAVIIATFAHNAPALLTQQAILPAFTVLRRILHTRATIAGKTPVTDVRLGNIWMRLRLWRYPRMSLPYDLVTGINIAWLIFAPVPVTDVLRNWFA